MNIKQLKSFQTVCEYNNITKAAEKLHVSQPSVSWAIKELEEELGVILFERNRNKIYLTDTGKFLLKRVNYILNYVNLLADEVRAFDRKNKSVLRLGLSEIGSQIILQMDGFQESFFSEWNVVIFEDSEKGIEDQIRQQTLEYGIVLLDQNTANSFEHKIITEVELCCCVNDGHPLAGHASISLRDMEQYPLLCYQKGIVQNRILSNFIKQWESQPNSIVFSRRQYAIESILRKRKDFGAILIRESLQNPEGIAAIPLEPAIKLAVAVIWDKKDFLHLDAATFPERLVFAYQKRRE